MSFIEEYAVDLNERQLEAVVRTEGPLLVLAGAGSGKTRVLTYRIAHLVQDHEVPLSSILAMTFSNKAAREMQERVHQLLNLRSPMPWISTFHSVGARLLRRFGDRIHLGAEFAIYDEGEQRSMVKGVMENLRINDKEYSPDAIHGRIGQWKNAGVFVSQLDAHRSTTFDDISANVYIAYEAEMERAQAVDFDDLLLKTYRLMRENEDLRQAFREQWRYILIDEFQDTNELQYKLLLEVLNEHKNICVVGDDDQSIYGWRGAKIDNILNFDSVFKDCTVVKLEQNYRSTSTILKAADSIISKNEFRHEKHLWTSKGAGERIRYAALSDDRGESGFVVSEIQKLIRAGVSAEEIAVLYRMNSLSRGFEEECLRQRVPYRIIGGFRFYERKEIKDALAYLKVLLNPADIMSFRRSVNTPARGIGKTTIEKIETAAQAMNVPVAEYLVSAGTLPGVGKGREGLQRYRDILTYGFRALKSNESFVDLMVEILDKSNYVNSLKQEDAMESAERLENVKELMSAIQEFEEGWVPQESIPEGRTTLKQKLIDFLERVSLISDADQLDSSKSGIPQAPQQQVTFMSIHAAKGLEFKYCFVAGMEEGIFPSFRSMDDYQRVEEERRLAYVAITRAKEKLFLTRALRRRTFGSINANVESRFLKDIPKDLFDVTIAESEDHESGYSFGARSFSRRRQAAAPAVSDDFDFDFDQRAPDSEFSRGDKVVHPSFGEGIVQKIEMLGTDECLSIVFQRAGKKKVLSKFVKAI